MKIELSGIFQVIVAYCPNAFQKCCINVHSITISKGYFFKNLLIINCEKDVVSNYVFDYMKKMNISSMYLFYELLVNIFY